MNPQDPLAQLHPLREPELIGWWPLAPGWWVLLALLVLALLALLWIVIRRYRANAYRRQALAQLARIQDEFREAGDDTRCLQQVNALLKSVALEAYPRRQVAAASGEQWRAFLNGCCRGEEPFDRLFTDALYQADAPELDPTTLFDAARRWIARHEVTA